MSELPFDRAKDRKEWHRLAAIMGDKTDLCPDCGGPLEQLWDEINGGEWVCKNPDCPGNNY